MSNVLRSEPGIDASTATLLSQLSSPDQVHHPIDLSVWVRWYAFDVIGALFFSAQFGFLEKREDRNGWIAAADSMGPLLTLLGAAPRYARPVIQGGSLVVPFALRGLRALMKMGDAAEECIKARREMGEGVVGGEGKGDMLEGVMKLAQRPGKEEEYGILEAKSEIFTAL